MFETNPKDLKDILREAAEGRLQLPDFQRSYVWSDKDVKSLIASIARGFPVGALLTLESGGEVNFKPRVLEGVAQVSVAPEQLLLDGQQRITSLYGALWGRQPMLTRAKRDRRKAVKRLYYLDIRVALADLENIENAIFAVTDAHIQLDGPGHNQLDGQGHNRRDLSTRKSEFDAHAFPLNQVFDPWDWIFDWMAHWKALGTDVDSLRQKFKAQVLDVIQSYKMPVIKLAKTSSRAAICLIFEKVNVGGKKLDAFELVTAIFAGNKEPLDLRSDWDGDASKPGRRARILQGKTDKGNANQTLREVKNTDLLQAISLIHTRECRLAYTGSGDPTQVSCKREALLALPLDKYRAHADAAEEGFRKAGRFLNEQKILWQKDVPYPAQIVGLATVFALNGKLAEAVPSKEKLALWFWRVALAEDFGSATESKLAKDVPELVRWIEGGDEPDRLERLNFNEARLDNLWSRLSAAYKAINALLLRSGCQDFISGKPADLGTFYHDPMDIHHIFPKDWCKQKGIKPEKYDSIVNKTPISAETNRSIGGQAPSAYLARIETECKITPARLNDILTTHLIDPDLLRADDFDGFYAARKRSLGILIAETTRRPMATDSLPEETEFDLPDGDALDLTETA